MIETQTPRNATLKDVALRAGVTKATASFTLSGKRRASPQTHEAVLRAARELGYQPNLNAQRLSGMPGNTVALFALGLDLGIGTMQLSTLRERLNGCGFHVPLHSFGFSSWRHPDEQIMLLRDVIREKPRALICATDNLEEGAWAELRAYHRAGGLIVSYGGSAPEEEWDQVYFNGENNIYQVASHLTTLGHRDIGFCTQQVGTQDFDFGGHGEHGFKRALEEVGAKINPRWLFGCGLYEGGGARLAQEFLRLPRAQRPTAMCMINDVSASTFVQQLLRAGVRVPEELSVTGTDDVPAAAHCIVALTTVSYPLNPIADHVIEMLFSRLQGDTASPPRRKELFGELVVRQSTAPPAQQV